MVASSKTEPEKEIRWVGSSFKDLKDFPEDALRQAGFQLGRVQNGLDPEDWKPFDELGPGVREVRLSEATGAFRVMYVAKFAEVVYVLHCFQKKTKATSEHDKFITGTRYRDVVRNRKGQK